MLLLLLLVLMKVFKCSIDIDDLMYVLCQVKEELRVMRDERKNKENAFRLMQRESKQCELLQKEIKKLKEGRVALAKQVLYDACEEYHCCCIIYCVYTGLGMMHRFRIISISMLSNACIHFILVDVDATR